MPYSIDTSAFLDAWVRSYPPDVFPSLWNQMHLAASSGVLFVIEEVAQELDKKEDGACQWIKDRPSMIVRIDSDIQAAVAEILRDHPRLVDSRKSRSGGDPWVIALARVRGYCVVTGERATGKVDRPNIPDVCARLGIRCVTILEMFREQHWSL